MTERAMTYICVRGYHRELSLVEYVCHNNAFASCTARQPPLLFRRVHRQRGCKHDDDVVQAVDAKVDEEVLEVVEVVVEASM